ncbi:MAG: ISKra4 family transposase, partial [Hormoscilla sp. GM102CHS1]|nr:ISKra4 family transposase [Hormoscilla sp. GM102CHS1]
CEWRDYKAVNLHDQGVAAFFRDNAGLVKWVNQQPLANPLVCLGDGHDGIWNLFVEIGPTIFRQEILDWYHLMENLEKIGGSLSDWHE